MTLPHCSNFKRRWA